MYHYHPYAEPSNLYSEKWWDGKCHEKALDQKKKVRQQGNILSIFKEELLFPGVLYDYLTVLNFYSEFIEKEYQKFIQLLKATLDIFCTNKVQENVYCLIEFKRWDAGTKYLGDISNNFH